MREASYEGTVSTPDERTPFGQDAGDTTRLEEQLRQLQKVDVIGHLAAGIAHDFNNILTVILGYTDLLEASVQPTDRVRADVAAIRRAAERAAGLTRQILAFTRKEVPNTGFVDLNAVVTDVSSMLTRLVGENVKLTVGRDSTLWRARADVSHIEQVLINLVVNARDAMPDGGRIAVATRGLTADPLFAAAHPAIAPGRYVVLEVADDGVGMTDEVRTRLFEPFFTTKGPGRGTGLGLSVVSSIVRQSNGHILVDSAPGRGTRFRVLLPAAAEALQEPVTPSFERRGLDGRATVLLVEDDEQVRSLAALWLRRYGYAVHEAADGDEALALRARGGLRPDLLITDVVMPGMGGGPLAESLRSVSSSVKVLYMSGYPNWPDVEDRLTERGVAFLQKPFSPGRLLRDVRSLLTWPGPERRSVSNWQPLPAAQTERSAKQQFRAPRPQDQNGVTCTG